MNFETRAAYRWLCDTPSVGDSCNRIVRDAESRAIGGAVVDIVARELRELVYNAFPAVVRPDEPDDFRETMRAGLLLVDWEEVALLFVEQERWRKAGRRAREKRKLARKRGRR